MPPPTRGSGGHINIFRFVNGLEQRGIKNRIVICNDGMLHPCEVGTAELSSQLNDWFGVKQAPVYYLKDMPASDVTFATGWQTAYGVHQFRSTKHKGYFVQDFEPLFYSAGAEHSFAEQTYKFGFTGYTAGSWLSDILRSKYGMKSYPMSFSYDKELYFPRTMDNPEKKHLLCYVRPETTRRGWELANLTLETVHQKDPSIEFILVGGTIDTNSLPYPAFNPGSLKLEELGPLYSQCKAALVLSFTNLSLLPLELMACGVPVVSNKGDFVQWLLNNDNASLADPTPASLAREILKIANLPEQQHRELKQKSIDYARTTSWEKQFDKMFDVITAHIQTKTAQTCSAA